MARFFGGMSGGSGSRSGGTKKPGATSYERSGGVKKASDMSAEERYQALISEKMSAQKGELMQSKKYSHQLPGTSSQSKEMSKTTKEAMEIIAQRMAKREMRKVKKPKVIEIKPTHVGGAYGGFIDAKGAVWAPGNKKVLQIDMKTGDMKTQGFFGRKIGKYDPKSQFCFNKIQKIVEKEAIKGGYGAKDMWGNSPSSGGGIWGTTSSTKDDGGSGWW